MYLILWIKDTMWKQIRFVLKAWFFCFYPAFHRNFCSVDYRNFCSEATEISVTHTTEISVIHTTEISVKSSAKTEESS